MDNPNGGSGELVVTRRCLLGVTGMGLLVTSGPGLAQIPMIPDVTERRKATMDIKRNGSRPSTKAPEAYFSGAVRVEPVFQVGEPVRLNGGSVTFEPGARTAWHTHPLGQTLIVTAGLGWVQTAGGPIEEIRPGDVVWFPRRRAAMRWPQHPNLRRRPPQPAKGNGRLQRAVARAFIAAGTDTLSRSEIYDWCLRYRNQLGQIIFSDRQLNRLPPCCHDLRSRCCHDLRSRSANQKAGYKASRPR